MNIFLICPVRGKDQAFYAEIVAGLERDGHAVHWPPRDTDQSDETGLRICRDNAAAIAQADVVNVVWDGQSQGCLFDLGVAFALGKRVAAVDLPVPTDGKSFQNMIRAWAAQGMEAGTAETSEAQAPCLHDSPVAESDAPQDSLISTALIEGLAGGSGT
jgi:nucleoside 2-deoxyribosyltransferase